MSTPNFCKYEASKYYAIGMTEDINDYHYYNDLKENIKDALETVAEENNYKTLEYENIERTLNRSYGGNYVGSIAIEKMYGDIEIGIICHVIISNGYYSGATLDYITEIQINGYDHDNADDFLKHFNTSYIECYSEMSAGLQKIQSKHIKKHVQKMCPEICAKVEKLLSEYCEQKYICIAVFSNGEPIYSAVS